MPFAGALPWFLEPDRAALCAEVDSATDVEALRSTGRVLLDRIEALQRGGVGALQIARLVTAVNRTTFQRLYTLVTPPELQRDACLIVMGSEGRGEQILRTDQDNGMVLRDGRPPPDLAVHTRAFSATLAELGYPPCPGAIMVSNPYWAKPAGDYAAELERWVRTPDPSNVMHLAMFIDAVAVAGDGGLLEGLQHRLRSAARGNDLLHARFAQATLNFPTPLTWLGRLRTRGNPPALDLKKGGIFALVHGVRSLALAHGLECTGTVERLQALSAAGAISRELGTDLIAAFDALTTLRLAAGLGQRRNDTPLDNTVRPADLDRIERARLREALRAVDAFKAHVARRFRLATLA